MISDFIYELPFQKRIIIIGDVHGDIKRFKNILIDAKIINNDFEWIAQPPETVILQLGDQIDSKNRFPNIENWEVLKDYEMIYFTDKLNLIARAKGGYCISLIGNHELMNIIGDFTYVSPNSSSSDRTNLFKVKGSLALSLAKRPLVCKIGDLLFCHAKFDLEHLNYLENAKINSEDKVLFDNIILGSNGILWNRNENNSISTSLLFKELGITYMFLGHTCYDKIILKDDQIWYCDTGLSRSFGKNNYQYLDINGININIKTIKDD